jgi:DNA repair protein REV1
LNEARRKHFTLLEAKWTHHRLATKTAKPCGQYFVESDKVLEFLMPISIRDLPGIGYAMEDKMNSMNVETIGDLRKYQMPVLQEKFGKKTGETLYKFARGIDDRPLSVGQPRQSVSAEVSWGVRFENDEQVNDFVLGLCKEVEKRLHNVGCKGRSITMKIKRRQLEAMEASMHLGHGMCDNFSKSITLDRHTDDALVIFDEAIKLLKSHEFAAGDIRGKFDFDPQTMLHLNNHFVSFCRFGCPDSKARQ